MPGGRRRRGVCLARGGLVLLAFRSRGWPRCTERRSGRGRESPELFPPPEIPTLGTQARNDRLGHHAIIQCLSRMVLYQRVTVDLPTSPSRVRESLRTRAGITPDAIEFVRARPAGQSAVRQANPCGSFLSEPVSIFAQDIGIATKKYRRDNSAARRTRPDHAPITPRRAPGCHRRPVAIAHPSALKEQMMPALDPIPYTDAKLRRILSTVRTIAMAGASSNWNRP